MTPWDAKERREMDTKDHDLLIQIDTKLDNVLSQFTSHVKEDEEGFKTQDLRIRNLEKVYWMGVGIIVVINVVFKFLK